MEHNVTTGKKPEPYSVFEEGRAAIDEILCDMLLAAVFLGASFPLAVRIFARSAELAGGGTARVYAWNTAGAVVGSSEDGTAGASHENAAIDKPATPA